MGARQKLRQFFLAHLGEVLTSDDLREASGNISQWARRVRELRNEEGYLILIQNDRTDLKPGEYLLEEAKPQPAFSRHLSKELRAQVLERNGFTCQMCGAVAGEIHPNDGGRRTRLHIGHIVDKSAGGQDVLSNLRALCSVCNEGISNITLQKPEAHSLLVNLRRAKKTDQIGVLRWLVRKFPNEVKEILEGS